MADAVYYHSSLYLFGEEARRAIILQFNAEVRDVTVKCSYDAVQHVFCLTFPSSQQAERDLDQILHEIIDSYVNDELAAAEREGRAPRITRFGKSEPDDANLISDEPSTMVPLQATPAVHNASPVREAAVTHTLASNVGPSSELTLLKLRDMPEGILERTLTSSDAASRKTVSHGYRLRAVMWSRTHEAYIYNARVGAPVQVSSNSSFGIIISMRFLAIKDQRPDAEVDNDHPEEERTQHWKFVGGKTPTIQQFLAGMGDTELDDPEQEPAMPPDARKFIQRPDYGGSATSGRVRVPKTKEALAQTMQPEEASDDEDDCGFANLLPTAQKSDDQKEKNLQSHASVTHNPRKLIDDEEDSFAALLGRSAPAAPKSQPQAYSTTMKVSHQASKPVKSGSEDPFTSSSSDMQTSSRQSGPRNTALTKSKPEETGWDTIENVSPPKQKVNKTGIGRRQPKVPSTSTHAPLAATCSVPSTPLSPQSVLGDQLEASFGVIMLRRPKDMQGVYRRKEVESKLSSRDDLRLRFFPRLSTSDADIQYLLTTFKASAVVGTLHYEVHIVTPGQGRRIIHIDASADHPRIGFVTEVSPLDNVYVHHPYNVWDVRICHLRPTSDDALLETCSSFIASIHTLEPTPSFQAAVPINNFQVEQVLAKRTFTANSSLPAHRGITLKVAEVQELQVEASDHHSYNLMTTAVSRETMVDDQRLWWEASLTTKDTTAGGRKALQAAAEGMAEKMDGVGFNNRGPWIREAKFDQSAAGSEMVPFW